MREVEQMTTWFFGALEVRKVNTKELGRETMISLVFEPNIGMDVISYSRTRG